MRLYVIGPVTGRENLNRAAFEEARAKLEQAGYDVMTPHDVVPPDENRADAMRTSIKTMLGCEGVAMLADWGTSPGARFEDQVAAACGLQVHRVDKWLRMAGDCPENDSSPEETQNPPSDGVLAPSNEVLGALTRRMDETNALLRAVYGQISALTAIEVGELTKSTCDYPKQVAHEALDKAKDISRSAQKCFESAGKENQDGEA